MSASIIGVKAWSTASPQEISSVVKAASDGRWYDGQKVFDTLNAREKAWRNPDETDDAVCIWNYPTGDSCDVFRADGPDGKVEVVLFFNDETGDPDALCVIDPGSRVDDEQPLGCD